MIQGGRAMAWHRALRVGWRSRTGIDTEDSHLFVLFRARHWVRCWDSMGNRHRGWDGQRQFSIDNVVK